MSPLLLVLALAAPALAGPTPVLKLQEAGAKAAARSYAAELCKTAPPSCGEAKSLLADYETALLAATACDAGKCKIETITAQAKAVADLDRRQSALMPPAGRTDRPFLALSAIALARLTAAATRLGKPYHAVIYGPDKLTEAKRALEAYCLDAPAGCGEMRGILSTRERASVDAASCEASACALDKVDAIVTAMDVALGDYARLEGATKQRIIDIWTELIAARGRGIALLVPLADGLVVEMTKGADAMSVQLDKAENDRTATLDGVEKSGRDMFLLQREASRAADQLANHLGYDPAKGAGERREKVNAVEIRLAGLRARALALRAARGLADTKGDAGAIAAGAAGGGAGGKAATEALKLSEPPKTIVDGRFVPSVKSGASGEAPPIVAGTFGPTELGKRALSKDPVVQADAYRRLGITKTIGDPARYVGQAFTQKNPNTCAVAAQVQILRAHGLLPTGVDPKLQEEALKEEADKAGYLQGGTPPAYVGSLLTERGLIVTKKSEAPWSELEAAIRRGGVIEARIDAGPLWYKTKVPLMTHAILITGAEISKGTDRILGVYINDSGDTPPGAGRFVPIDLLKTIWLKSFAEVR